MTTTTKCEFCDKRGLPLLLVRDAVAPSKSGAPVAPSLPIELAASAAHYTKRLIRKGYVNVFDEARRRWESYAVTSDNYFFKLLQTPGSNSALPAKPFNCPDEGHRAVASCITIMNPANATKVWIGFSDVEWTEAVRKANEDAVYRKLHMAEIDVKALLKGIQAPHRPIMQLAAVVAEYAMQPSQSNATLGWSPFKFSSRYGHADRLKQECESMRPGTAAIVTIPDPSGIAQELAFLMKRNADLFVKNNPGDRQRLAASVAIDQIKNAVCTQAQNGEIEGSEKIANQREEEDPIGHWLSESTRARTEKIRALTSGNLENAASTAWEKYSNKFDDESREKWAAPFKERFKNFDANFIAPLALNHVAWMKSKELGDYFECNYDPLHAESGAVFTATLTHCIAATEEKQACANLYQEWLKGDIADKRNLLLRAMILNQNLTANAVRDAVSVSISLRQIPWDNIFSVSNGALARLSGGVQGVTARLIVQIAGSIARVFNKIMDGSVGFRAAVMATGLISGHPVVVCEIEGTRKDFHKYLVKQLLQSSGQVVSEKVMERAVRIEMRRQQIYGVSVEGTGRRHFLMVADRQVIASMPDGLSPQQKADYLARSIKTVKAVDELNLNRWRSVINSDVRLGIVTGILQAVSLSKLMADQEKSLSNEKSDVTRRYYAGLATVAGTTMEIIGNILAQRTLLGLRFGQGIASTSAAVLKAVGKGAGFLAGLYSAGLDVVKAAEAATEKQAGLAWLYAGSALFTFGVTAAMLFTTSLAALPVIGILVVILIGINLLIEHNKDNPVQDWLERCPWGILTEQRYADLPTQQDQLLKALGE
jgi:hypothetical protein